MEAIAEYEQVLSGGLLDAILSIGGATVYGVTDRARLDRRVPTVSFTIDGVASSVIATQLASRGIGVRSGHMYAPRLMQRLGLMPEGTVRVSLVHYNSLAEIARFATALGDVVAEILAGRTHHQVMFEDPDPAAVTLHVQVAEAVREGRADRAEELTRQIAVGALEELDVLAP